MYNFYDSSVEVQHRVSTETVGTGFTERWESQGEFDCCIREQVAVIASYQQQFSNLGQYEIVFPEDIGASYGNTRFLATSGRYTGRLFEPDEKPYRFGASTREEVVIQVKELTGLTAGDTAVPVESDASPPIDKEYPSTVFTGDGLTCDFHVGYDYVPGSTQVVLDSALQYKDVDYYEVAQGIRMLVPPWKDQELKVSAQETPT